MHEFDLHSSYATALMFQTAFIACANHHRYCSAHGASCQARPAPKKRKIWRNDHGSGIAAQRHESISRQPAGCDDRSSESGGCRNVLFGLSLTSCERDLAMISHRSADDLRSPHLGLRGRPQGRAAHRARRRLRRRAAGGRLRGLPRAIRASRRQARLLLEPCPQGVHPSGHEGRFADRRRGAGAHRGAVPDRGRDRRPLGRGLRRTSNPPCAAHRVADFDLPQIRRVAHEP